MYKLVQLDVFQLNNVSRVEADGAKLRDKQQLEKLLLSWKRKRRVVYEYMDMEAEESDTDTEEESSPMHDNEPGSGPLLGAGLEMENLQMNGTNNYTLRSEQFIKTAEKVLEGFEPHHNLKRLQIFGYNGATSPTWLSTSVTCLQALHLGGCRNWQTLPFLERLPFLTKLKLMNMREVIQVSIPPLEELVLIGMIKLETCSCNYVKYLNSSLRVLEIRRCSVLKDFSIFESCEKLKIEKNTWLLRLTELTVQDCPLLTLSHPLPPSANISKLSITRVATLPRIKRSSSEKLTTGIFEDSDDTLEEDNCDKFDEFSDELTKLDYGILSFHNLIALTDLRIACCRNLTYVSFEGFRQLISLKRLEIKHCEKLFSSDVLPEHIHEGMSTANFNALPSLQHLKIYSCGITGKWVSVMLQHVSVLEELCLGCLPISEISLSHRASTPWAPSAGNKDGALAWSTPDGLLRVPSNIISSLKKMSFGNFGELTFQANEEGLTGFTSLEELIIRDCPDLISSLVYKAENNEANEIWLLPKSLGKLEIISHWDDLGTTETLRLCFPGNLTRLKKLYIQGSSTWKTLQLHSCTALEELRIVDCGLLAALDDLQSLTCLKYVKVLRCPRLPPYLELLSSRGYKLCPRLESLVIDDCTVLTTSFCMCLTSLNCLQLDLFEGTGLTEEQDRALQGLESLQELCIYYCCSLVDLPAGLHSLPSLKRLKIKACWGISSLPEKGLPPSLEELEIWGCTTELTAQCRGLATSMLKVETGLICD